MMFPSTVFFASIDNNNIVTLTQEVNPPTDAPKIKPFTDNLQNLINTYGFTKIQFNPEQIKNYLVKK
jgi:hypothetical protein